MKVECETVTLENAILLHAAGYTSGSMWIWSKNLMWNGKEYEKWQVNWWEKYRMAVDMFKAKPEYCAWTFNELLEKLREKCKLSTMKMTCATSMIDKPNMWIGSLITYENEIVTTVLPQPTAQDVLAHLLIKLGKQSHLLDECNTQGEALDAHTSDDTKKV